MGEYLILKNYQIVDYLLTDKFQTISGFEVPMNIWNKTRGERLMPLWSDFSFESWIGWHSKMCLTDIFTNPLRQQERIMGDIYRNYFGKLSDPEMEQQDYDQKEYDAEFLKVFHDYMERQYNDPFICSFKGYIPKEGAKFKNVHIVDLPLTDEDGIRAKSLLSFMLVA